jgi:hypothetical protein
LWTLLEVCPEARPATTEALTGATVALRRFDDVLPTMGVLSR